MPAHVKICAYCKFDIRITASVCGHCGAKFREEVYQRGWSIRSLLGIWGLVKGAFTSCIVALAVGYFFADPGKIAVWGMWGAVAGAILGFIEDFSESKTKTIEFAERD